MPRAAARGVNPTEWSDTELVAAVVAGHEVAYSELYRRHVRMVTGAARTILGSSNHADDVAADVLFDFWRRPGRFDGTRGSLIGFLRTQARGRGIDLLRSEGARARREVRQVREARRSYLPDEDVLRPEGVRAVRAAVSRLPERERTAIELAYFEGLSYRDVAARLGEPEGTVKSRIRSGLGRLKVSTAAIEYQPIEVANTAMAG